MKRIVVDPAKRIIMRIVILKRYNSLFQYVSITLIFFIKELLYIPECKCIISKEKLNYNMANFEIIWCSLGKSMKKQKRIMLYKWK